jgi:hypothetical protein
MKAKQKKTVTKWLMARDSAIYDFSLAMEHADEKFIADGDGDMRFTLRMLDAWDKYCYAVKELYYAR